MALISLAACQNETSENLKVQASDEGVLKAVGNISAKYVGTSVIHCHTDYLVDTGHACVSNGGYLFYVSWSNYENAGNGQIRLLPEPKYSATQVSSCGC